MSTMAKGPVQLPPQPINMILPQVEQPRHGCPNGAELGRTLSGSYRSVWLESCRHCTALNSCYKETGRDTLGCRHRCSPPWFSFAPAVRNQEYWWPDEPAQLPASG